MEQVYDAESRGTPWLRHLGEAFAYPALVLRHGVLVRNFFRREFLGRFRGSALGVLWVLVHPLFLFATYYLVFGLMFAVRSPAGAHPLWYPLYLFTGVLAWTVFAETAVRCTTVVVENGNLIKKVAFPAELLPLHLVAVNLVVYLVGVVAYFAIALATGFTVPGVGLLFLPLLLLVQALFTVGVGLALAAWNVFFRDVNQIFPIVANLWFFASPVFWYDQMLLGRGGDVEPVRRILALLEWNPMTPILRAHRAVLGLAGPDGSAAGARAILASIGQAALPALAAFVIGFLIFRSLQPRFADEV